jgi:hypothetical protein
VILKKEKPSQRLAYKQKRSNLDYNITKQIVTFNYKQRKTVKIPSCTPKKQPL